MAIPVTTPDGVYNIIIEAGLLSRIGESVDKYGLKGKVIVVTNHTIAPLYGEPLVRALPDAVLVEIPDGEQHKTLDTVQKLYAEFIHAGADRSTTIIALGGGVVGDTSGFAAATYMRGLRLVQIPTTLLSMVDSSVGGKVGVDLPQGKNLVGAFKQPDMVLIDTDVLRTLPARELRCGLAEAIKHGLIANEALFNRMASLPHYQGPQRDDNPVSVEYFDSLASLIPDAVQVKINIVEEDPYERNIRMFLNLGHTFAHAIELVSGYSWHHGEAVAVGLVAAARLSCLLDLCDETLVTKIEQVVGEAGLPLHIGNLDSKAIYDAMATDKKWRGGHSRFVLLKGMGKPTMVQDVATSDIMEVLDGLK